MDDEIVGNPKRPVENTLIHFRDGDMEAKKRETALLATPPRKRVLEHKLGSVPHGLSHTQ